MGFLDTVFGSAPKETTSATNVSLPFVKDFVWGMFDPANAKDPRIAAMGQWLAGLQPEYQKAFMDALGATSYDSRTEQSDRYAGAVRRQAGLARDIQDRSFAGHGYGQGYRAGAGRAVSDRGEDDINAFLRDLYSPEGEMRRRLARLQMLQNPGLGPTMGALGQLQGMANQVQTRMTGGSPGILGSLGSLAGMAGGGGFAGLFGGGGQTQGQVQGPVLNGGF